jgi:hypothetical protein
MTHPVNPNAGPLDPSRPFRLFERPDRHHHPLYVITPIFDPQRWRSRWRLYQDFADMCRNAGAQVELRTIEVAFGDRDHVITSPDNPHHIQVRSSAELWMKENLINLAVQRLPADWKYVAWVDADVLFARPDWGDETVHALQHYKFVQMWSQLKDLNPDCELLGDSLLPSFMDNYVSGRHEELARSRPTHRAGCECPCCSNPYYPEYPPYGAGYPGAPGLAWACTREAWDAVGGLIDTSIWAADWYIAHALVGRAAEVLRPGYSQAYKDHVLAWQERAERYIRRNVGVVKGLCLHYWHGPKSNRLYNTRDKILIDHQFDPVQDLIRDHQGLYKLVDHGDERSMKLRDGIRAYFRQRNEDALT